MLGEISSLFGERTFLVAQDIADDVYVGEEIARLCVRIVRGTRSAVGVELGASPRASRHLVAAAKARAAARGRKKVEVEDVTFLAPYVLNHRMTVADGTPTGDRRAGDRSGGCSVLRSDRVSGNSINLRQESSVSAGTGGP